MEDVIKSISGKLRGLRSEKGLSQEEVAEKLGVHRETFRKYENNPSSIEMGTFLKILDIYDIDTNYFFELVYGKMPSNEE